MSDDYLHTTPADRVDVHNDGSVTFTSPTLTDDIMNIEQSDIMDIEQSAEPELTVEQRIDWVAAKLIQLEAKIDNLTTGLTATYQGVSGLVTMLSAVQQVASMMPGGKKIAQAMMSAQSQNGAPNNGQ